MDALNSLRSFPTILALRRSSSCSVSCALRFGSSSESLASGLILPILLLGSFESEELVVGISSFSVVCTEDTEFSGFFSRAGELSRDVTGDASTDAALDPARDDSRDPARDDARDPPREFEALTFSLNSFAL